MRSNGRTDEHQLRPLSASFGVLSRADGSSRFGFGTTEVLASVFGPKEVRIRDEKIDSATLQISVRPLNGLSGPLHRLAERQLRDLIEAAVLASIHPRSAIQVTIQVTGDDGCFMSAAVNAASLALLDAGVAQRHLLASVTLAFDPNGTLLLDPSLKELETAKSVHTFTFSNSSDAVIAGVSSEGVYSQDEYKQACTVAQQACATIHSFYRKTMEQKLAPQ
ncbi:Exosome component 5 [Rhizoclosmatium sp. JEL0117]|nr:Exosome component 5 [Rhizoclosmatium sp. JEL0117]